MGPGDDLSLGRSCGGDDQIGLKGESAQAREQRIASDTLRDTRQFRVHALVGGGVSVHPEFRSETPALEDGVPGIMPEHELTGAAGVIVERRVERATFLRPAQHLAERQRLRKAG